MKIKIRQFFLTVAMLLFVFTIQAQKILDPLHRDIEPGTMPPIKVCITGFTGEVADVLNFDLYVTGFINVPRDQAQFVITGSNDANVQGRVLNPLNQPILSKAYSDAT